MAWFFTFGILCQRLCFVFSDDLKAIDSDTCRNSRDLLRKRAVHVPKARNVLIAESLYQVAQDDIEWPKNDPERPIGIIHPKENSALDNQRNKGCPVAHE